MQIFIVNCEFNSGRTVIDCAFKNEADARAYADAMGSDKAKAFARCKELITLRDGGSMVKFLDENDAITFSVAEVDLQ